MLNRLVLPAVLAGLFATGAPLAAQQVAARPTFAVTPYAGYMVFGDFIKGPLGTTLSSANGPLYGAQFGVNLTKNVALVGNVAHASGDLKVGVPLLGGLSVGHSSAWLYDGGVQLSAPSLPTSLVAIAPFAQVGAGAIRYDVATSLINTTPTNFAFNAGVGADVAFAPNFGLRLMVKDYMGRFDVKDATQLDVQGNFAHNIAISAGLKLDF